MIITEGALKAATVSVFEKDYDVLASAGVTCSHGEIVAAARQRVLFVAFDSDYYENTHVARALARLLDSLFTDSANLPRARPQVKILSWKPPAKGIDDALLSRVSIVSKSPAEWYESLSAACQVEVEHILPLISEKSVAVR